MAHRTKINGTAYEIKGGRTKVGGTGYDVKKGRTKVGGTGYDIEFSSPMMTITMVIPATGAGNALFPAGILATNMNQTVVIQVDSSLTTFADLAASSEYREYSPDMSGHTVRWIVSSKGIAAVLFKSGNNGEVCDMVSSVAELASNIKLTDGATIDLTDPSGSYTFENYDYTAGWGFQ